MPLRVNNWRQNSSRTSIARNNRGIQLSFFQAVYGFGHFDTRRVMRMSSIKTRQDPCSRRPPASQPVASGDASTDESRRLFPPHVRLCLSKQVVLLSSSKGRASILRLVCFTGGLIILISASFRCRSAQQPTQQSCPSKQGITPCLPRQNRRCLRM